MQNMRAAFVIAVSIAGLFAVPARAADLPAVYWGDAPSYGYPAAPVVIYDDNPGVTMRAYWEAPWAGRRYFPANGVPPKLGRRENPFARHVPYPPAETYYRNWMSLPPFDANVAAPAPGDRSALLSGDAAAPPAGDVARRHNRHRLRHRPHHHQSKH
jgi:hypothetical protein